MPLYYKHLPRGYDLDEERDFIMIDGEKCCVGSAGSIILGCRICGAEHFRDRVSEHESCSKGHGRMHPIKFSERDHYHALWIAQGDTIVSIEQRRAERLKRELERPLDWTFGGKTEADFPDGYVKKSHEA